MQRHEGDTTAWGLHDPDLKEELSGTTVFDSGRVYQGAELDDHRDACGDVEIKVSLDTLAWHGEAYFGWLLSDEAHVVRIGGDQP